MSLFLVILQALVVPAQKLAAQCLVGTHTQLRNDVARLLGRQQPTAVLEAMELGLIGRAHGVVVNFADLALHLSVDDAWADGDRRNVRLLDAQGQGEVIQDSLAGAVCAPALVCASCCARGCEDNAAMRGAQRREGGLDLGWCVSGMCIPGDKYMAQSREKDVPARRH
jgi:hypothetical protein